MSLHLVFSKSLVSQQQTRYLYSAFDSGAGTLQSYFSYASLLPVRLCRFSSVAQLYPTLWDPVDCSTPGFPVHHQLSKLAQTYVYRVGNAIQPSHPRVWKAGKGGRDFLLTICFLFLVYIPAVLASPWPVKQQFILVFNFSSHQESGLLHSFRNISTSWPALLLQRSGSSSGGFLLPASSYSNPHASFCFLSLRKDNCFLLGYLSVSFLPWLSSSTWLIVLYIKFFAKMLMWFSVSCQACLRHWPWLFLISFVECSRLCVCDEVGDEVHVQSLQSYYPMDCSPPGSSIHGILQARILEWVTMPSSKGSSQPRDQTCVSCIAGGFFTHWAISEALLGKEYNIILYLLRVQDMGHFCWE